MFRARMLLSFLDRWWDGPAGWGHWQALEKTTSRAALAALASFALAVCCGPYAIRWLRSRFREPIKIASPQVAQLHRLKESTPTMGGLFIVGGLIGSTLVFGDLSNGYVAIATALVLSLAALGACDDLVKLTTDRQGLRARTKLLAQTVIALFAAVAVYRLHRQFDGGLDLAVPMFEQTVHLGWVFVPFATLVMVGSSNAVNLTDGLDGLAGGCLLSATVALALLVYASGHAQWAHYLGITHVAGGSEMTIIAAATVGAVLGFLWFNCHPASVFMGDTGSLPLGGLMGLLAVVARQELLLLAIGGVFVAEAASVIVQVGVFHLARHRVFRCAPLHHHFQLLGWSENKIVIRFWIAAALCAVGGLASLKLGAAPSDVTHVSAAQRTFR
jgi:phospho-N-acetylmuramoyl-pentapeptide-transferase